MTRDIPIIFSGPMVRALLEGRKTQTRRLFTTKGYKPDPQNTEGFYRTGRIVHDTDIGVRTGLDYVEYRHRKQDDPAYTGSPSPYYCKLRYRPGDRLYVRETHYRYGRWVKDGMTEAGRQRWRFKAAAAAKLPSAVGAYFDDERDDFSPAPSRTEMGWHKRPAIHMPRWASRLTLEVTAVKVEKLQAISEDDARDEGVTEFRVPPAADAHREPCRHCGESRLRHVGVAKGCFGGMGTLFSPGTLYGGFASLWVSLHGRESWDANPEVVALSFKVIKQNIDSLPKQEAA